jgi:hypothetical protein
MAELRREHDFCRLFPSAHIPPIYEVHNYPAGQPGRMDLAAALFRLRINPMITASNSVITVPAIPGNEFAVTEL